MIFQTMGNPPGPPGHNHPGTPMPGNPFALLSQIMMNPANARDGDAVFSQEALDRVISQLMEQNAGSTAPPPAAEEAIRSLPTKKVEESMMGNDGKAECSICMDSVEIGEDVTALPCQHWFHGVCVTAWLKEHDTCPHCRKGISKPPGDAQRSQSEQPSQSRRSIHRRSSSVNIPASPGVEGSRVNAITVPESPRDIRSARQHYFESTSGDPYDRRQNSRPSSHNESRRPENPRTGSRGSNGSNIGGWIRNHMPFQ